MREDIVLVLEIVMITLPGVACSKIQHEKPHAKGDLTHVILEYFHLAIIMFCIQS